MLWDQKVVALQDVIRNHTLVVSLKNFRLRKLLDVIMQEEVSTILLLNLKIETETFTIGNSHMKNKREIKLERYLLQNIDDANSQRTTEKHFEAIKEQIMKQGDVEAILK